MKLRSYIILVAIFTISPALLYFGYKLYRDYEIEMAYQESVAPFREAYERSAAYLKEADRIERKYEAMLKADHYGGKTPEETLDMFVDALKKRDYKLAAKYYLPWKRKEAEEDLRDWMENYSDKFEEFLSSYKENNLEISTIEQIGVSTIFIKNDENKHPYAMFMQKNKVNDIWKIEKF